MLLYARVTGALRPVLAICFSLLKLLFSAARAVHCTATKTFSLRCAASAASCRRQLEAAASPWPSILCGFRTEVRSLHRSFCPSGQGVCKPTPRQANVPCPPSPLTLSAACLLRSHVWSRLSNGGIGLTALAGAAAPPAPWGAPRAASSSSRQSGRPGPAGWWAGGSGRRCGVRVCSKKASRVEFALLSPAPCAAHLGAVVGGRRRAHKATLRRLAHRNLPQQHPQ